MWFSKDTGKQIPKDISFSDIGKWMAQKWKELSMEEKQKYKDREEYDRIHRYNKEYEVYLKILNDSSENIIKQQKMETKNKENKKQNNNKGDDFLDSLFD